MLKKTVRAQTGLIWLFGNSFQLFNFSFLLCERTAPRCSPPWSGDFESEVSSWQPGTVEMETGGNLQIHRYAHIKCDQGGGGGGGGYSYHFPRMKVTRGKLLGSITVIRIISTIFIGWKF